VLGSLAALLIGAHMYQAHALSQLQNELSGLRSELQSLNLKVKEVGDLQNKIKDFRSKNKIIEDLNRKRSGPTVGHGESFKRGPASLWLTDFKESAGSLTMNGLAIDNQTIADFMKAIAQSKYFTNVELVETTQGAGQSAALKKFALKTTVVYRPPESIPASSKPAPNVAVKKRGEALNQILDAILERSTAQKVAILG
jgi:type IV pilus assembly protein PilN